MRLTDRPPPTPGPQCRPSQNQISYQSVISNRSENCGARATSRNILLKTLGATVIGIVVVVGIVVLLTPGLQVDGRPAVRTKTMVHLKVLSDAINRFHENTGVYPASLGQLTTGSATSSPSSPPSTALIPDKQITIDAWERPFLYRYPGTHKPR